MKENLIGTWHRSITVRFVFLVVCVALPIIAWAQWNSSSSDIYNSNTGNVGVGTAAPGALLQVGGGWVGNRYARIDYGGRGTFRYDDNGMNDVVTFQNFGVTTNSHGIGLRFDFTEDGGTPAIAGRILVGTEGTWTPTPSTRDSFVSIWTLLDNDSSERVRITSAGNVGIGTWNPSSRLHVVGDVTVDGNISAKYQDLAEWVPSRQSLSSGSVVVLTPGQGNSVVRSTAAYDTRVAGVVSANPGIILGEAGEGKVRVATTGRVKVRVDASAAPIEVGDLLVTSSKEGLAMKSQPVSFGGVDMHRPGTLIGKALESLSEGEGEILVLLSLQ